MRLVLILYFIVVLQSRYFDFTNSFDRAYITGGGGLFIEVTSYFMSNGGKYYVVIIFNKILYVQAKAALLCYETL